MFSQLGKTYKITSSRANFLLYYWYQMLYFDKYQILAKIWHHTCYCLADILPHPKLLWKRAKHQLYQKLAILESSIKKFREIESSIIHQSILISRKNHFHFTEFFFIFWILSFTKKGIYSFTVQKIKSVGLTKKSCFHVFSTFTKKKK